MKKLVTVVFGALIVNTIFANNIEDSKKSETKISAVSAAAKTEMVNVEGVVIDESTGEPISGAEVKIEGTGISVYTDLDGNYNVSIPVGEYDLKVSLVSYKDQNIKLMSDTLKKVKIELEEE